MDIDYQAITLEDQNSRKTVLLYIFMLFTLCIIYLTFLC